MGERTSYLTADEVAAIQVLPKGAPYSLCNVSAGYFSVARHAGGCTLHGYRYTYIHGHDECVRDDVLKFVRKLRKKKPAEAVPVQVGIFDAGTNERGD